MTRSIRLPRKAVLAVLITLCSGLVLAGCSGTKDAVDQTAGGQYKYVGATPRGKTIAAAKRKVAGPAKGSLLDGSAWSLRALKGQVVVVNYWGTWCAPCRIETPNFQRVYQQFKAQGVTFVGIDVKETSSSPAKAFVKDNAITFPIVYDAGAKTALQIGRLPLQGLPNTVVIDKQGKVAAVYVGPVQPGDLEPVLTSLAAEH